MVWEFTKLGDEFEDQFHRSVSNVSVHDGLVIAADFSGLVHCLDARTGQRHWVYDAFAAIYAQPLIVDGKIYVADEDSDIAVFRLSADPEIVLRSGVPLAEMTMGNSVHCSPIFANGTLYIASRDRLYAVCDIEAVAPQTPARSTSIAGDRLDARAAPAERRRPRTGVGRAPDAVFVPTRQDVVERMLELASVTKDDIVCDLGSGDGRIVLTAARKYRAKAIGYEIDAELVKLSRESVERQQLGRLVTIEHQDFFTVDLSGVDVVAVYLQPPVLERLLPQLKKLKPGSRIVAHHFAIPGVKPDKTIEFHSDDDRERHTLHLWTTPLEPDGSE